MSKSVSTPAAVGAPALAAALAVASLINTTSVAGADADSSKPVGDQPKPAVKVKVRVLVNCAHGAPNDVAVLDAELAAQAEAAGEVDAAPAAVAYAESQHSNEQA